jgi:hypothetical protein
MDEKTMMNEIKFLVNKYVSQEQTKAEKKCIEIESNMRVLETLPLVKSLRERIAYLEKELDVYRSKEQPKSPSDWGKVLMQVDERVVIDLCDTVSEKDEGDNENDNDDDDEVKNQIVQETHVDVDDQPESSSENDRASVQTDDVDEGVDVESEEEDDEVEGEKENKEISLCKNTDCVAEKNDDYSESCNVCDGYFKDDGLNDILFIEEEPNNKKASCDLCKETNNIVQMKGTGQYMCQNACDEEEEEEVEAEEEEDEDEEEVAAEEEEEEEAEEEEEEEAEEEEEEEEVEAEEEEEEVEEEEEEVEAEAEEEEAEEEEEEVEEEEEEEEAEEEVEVFEHVIDGKTYYVTSLTNGEIFDVDDDEFENPVGTIKDGKVIMTM